MSVVTVYHNPKCSKCRQTLALLQERDIEPTLIEYLITPPSADELDHILELLGKEPRDLMRRKEAAYQDADADNADLTRTDLIAIMVQNPSLIERPIVLANGKAAIGRPPENVLEIL